MSQRTWLLVKGTPVWVYKRVLILNCKSSYYYLIYSYFIHYSYMDYFVRFQVFWITLVWANFVRLIWYQSKFWSGPWPHFIQTLFELAFSQPLHFGASPIPRSLTKNRPLAIHNSRNLLKNNYSATKKNSKEKFHINYPLHCPKLTKHN